MNTMPEISLAERTNSQFGGPNAERPGLDLFGGILDAAITDVNAGYRRASIPEPELIMKWDDENRGSGIFEIKERVFIESHILRAVVANEKNIAGIVISNYENCAGRESSQCSAKGPLCKTISFNVGELFIPGAEEIAAATRFEGNGPAEFPESVLINIRNLLKMVSEYPDPIRIQIGNFDNRIAKGTYEPDSGKRMPEVRLSFDLRELAKAELSKSQPIRGILISEKSSIDRNQEYQLSPMDNIPDMSRRSSGRIAENGIESDRAAPNGQGRNPGNVIENPGTNSNVSEPFKDSPEMRTCGLGEGMDWKPRSRNRVNSFRQTKAAGKLDMAVAPDQYGARKIRDRYLPLEMKESENIQLASIDNLKSLLLQAIDKNERTLRLRLEPRELGFLDIKLQMDDGGVSVRMRPEGREAFVVLNKLLPGIKGELEAASKRIIEIRITGDQAFIK